MMIDPTRMVTRSMRIFEFFIGGLVLVVLASFVALLVRVSPVWKDAFRGYVPSSGIVSNGALYIAVGIIGATVMPHAFFIGSKMATMRRLQPSEYGEEEENKDEIEMIPTDSRRNRSNQISLHLPQPFSLRNYDFDINEIGRTRSNPSIATASSLRSGASEEEKEKDDKDKPEPIPAKPTLACVRAHLNHAMADIIGSLMGFAVVINSMILMLAAAVSHSFSKTASRPFLIVVGPQVFYYGQGRADGPAGVSDLFDAFALIKEYIGSAFAYLFAVALFAAGQSASLTVTLAGQILSEGCIRWRTTPWKRRLITRCIGIVPSLAVAVSVGREGIDTLLVASQVALSIVLSFVLVP